ncbi:hypothetical protein FF011L_25460 [Roseimaritima multifibrata]|uniref:DUF4159 domain-containing protein n=1 Tax=Roseimaritima multifibrata TaxID=1930274 RepID=A0A517MFW0_9BACT|nr:DUF4159 domain-containing protein [Roseimaritima multifibrata]QDS93773.1 hypothetical protein FF011L_25460 [Roseimaritima multifibrata]
MNLSLPLISKRLLVVACLGIGLTAATVVAVAQRGRFRSDYRNVGRNGVPDWDVDRQMEMDTFTFARVRYNSFGRRGGWDVDYPDSDLNFSLRLQQLTSLKVNPNPKVLDLTDPKLFDYPFLYLIEPGAMFLSPPEVAALRRYLLNGGFLMVDDFWGDQEYAVLAENLSRVFPDRVPEEVPLEHDIFHCVYDLKERPQVPSLNAARPGNFHGEFRPGSDTSRAIYRSITDDEGRIMVFICHNTDLGDGWEREGEDAWYFEEYSVKKAYPMGINIVTYAMTH